MKFCILNVEYLFFLLSDKKQELDFANQCFAQTLPLFYFSFKRARKKTEILFRVLLT